MDFNYVREQVNIEEDGFICPDSGQKSILKKMDFICPLWKVRTFTRTHLRTNLRPRHRQDKDFNYVRAQVKIAKDGFICQDISQNVKLWIIYVQSLTPQRTKIWIIYVRTQVKIAKDGNYVWWINLSYTVLTSTLVLGINYFVIITRPLHPIPVYFILHTNS